MFYGKISNIAQRMLSNNPEYKLERDVWYSDCPALDDWYELQESTDYVIWRQVNRHEIEALLFTELNDGITQERIVNFEYEDGYGHWDEEDCFWSYKLTATRTEYNLTSSQLFRKH